MSAPTKQDFPLGLEGVRASQSPRARGPRRERAGQGGFCGSGPRWLPWPVLQRPPPPFCGIGHRLARPRSLCMQPCSAHQKFEQVSPMGDLRAPGPGSPCHTCRGSEAGRCRLQRAILSQCGILTYCHLISQVVQREKFLPGTWKLFYSISNAELMFTL